MRVGFSLANSSKIDFARAIAILGSSPADLTPANDAVIRADLQVGLRADHKAVERRDANARGSIRDLSGRVLFLTNSFLQERRARRNGAGRGKPAASIDESTIRGG
jgi:hypothetical protein